jgi:Spy/CpxP family protein refolding chaperone
VLLVLRVGAAAGAPAGSSRDSTSLTQELELSKPQEERMTALRTRVQAETRALSRQMEERRRELNEVYRQFEMDERRAVQLRQAIRDIQGQVLEVHHTFQVELRKILTPSQFERLQQAMRRPRRHHRGPGRGRGFSGPPPRQPPG